MELFRNNAKRAEAVTVSHGIVRLLLTSLELGIFLVNDVQTSFATDNLVISGTLLERCSNLHNVYEMYL